ncbi:MAG: PA14 domain-containing protein [Anaerolineales bacterium]
MKERLPLRTILIALGALVLFVVGLSVVVVNIARSRVQPEPTAPLALATMTKSSTATAVSISEILTPRAPGTQEPDTVVGVVRSYEPGGLIIVIVPTEGVADQIIVPDNIEVLWLSGLRASAREIVPGQTLYAEGQLDALQRLVADRIVIIEDAPPVTPTVGPTNTPTPTPSGAGDVPRQAWLGEYFANKDLSGAPTFTRQDTVLAFEWGLGSPHAEIPVDGFSARWRGRWPFEQGLYTFAARSDDGIRVYLDGALIINNWREQSAVPSTVELYVESGEHLIQVEYFESGGEAAVSLGWELQGAFPAWKGEYYSNATLSGQPTLVRNDNELSFNWGTNAPDSRLPANSFSARWTRSVLVAEAAYRFLARADDGVRVYVDDRLIIDEWHEARTDTYEGYAWLTAQPHRIRVEYYDNAGVASVNVWWEQVSRYSGWRGEYFANTKLDDPPFFVRNDDAIDFDWGNDSVGYGLPADNFAVRWTRTTRLDAGTYELSARADDGVRVYVDDDLIIDEWHDADNKRYKASVNLGQGQHKFVVEYYDHAGQAIVRFDWALQNTPTPTASATQTPTRTSTPTATVTKAPTTAIPATAVPTTAVPTDTPTLTATSEPSPTSATATATPPPTATSEPQPIGGREP